MKPEITAELFLEPGHVCLPAAPACVCSVTGSGVIMTMFDRRRKTGGMAHYSLPGLGRKQFSPVYAQPAIIGLFRLLKDNGSKTEHLSVSLYGAASNPNAPGFTDDIHKKNIIAAHEVLKKLQITVVGCDVGGHWGRKVAFHTGTGECVVIRTEKIRSKDWYPKIK